MPGLRGNGGEDDDLWEGLQGSPNHPDRLPRYARSDVVSSVNETPKSIMNESAAIKYEL